MLIYSDVFIVVKSRLNASGLYMKCHGKLCFVMLHKLSGALRLLFTELIVVIDPNDRIFLNKIERESD